jgi:hypothetical protein
VEHSELEIGFDGDDSVEDTSAYCRLMVDRGALDPSHSAFCHGQMFD